MYYVYKETCFSPKPVCYDYPELKHTDSPVKEKFLAQQSLKKVMLTVFLDMKGSIIIGFLEKGTIVKCFLLPNPLTKFTKFIE